MSLLTPVSPKSDTRSAVLPHTASEPFRPLDFTRFWTWGMPVIAGLLIRAIIALVWLGGTDPHNDAADYFLEATAIQNGTREAIPFYWPPGNSYYLAGWFAVFGSSMTVARMAMIVLSTLQIPVVGMLTGQATRSPRAVLLANWIWAVYPPAVFLVFQPYSQHLAAFSLAAIALTGILWMKNPSRVWALLLGCAVGVGCLTRPSMLIVALLVGMAILLKSLMRGNSLSKRVLFACEHGMLFGIATAVILAPTILHNSKTGGGYTLSTNNERNFFLGNNPYTPWYKTSHFAQRPLSELSPEVREYLTSMYQQPDRRAAMSRAAMEHLRQNPGLALLRTVNRARAFWGFDYLASRVIKATNGSRLLSGLVLLAEAAGYCIVMVLAIVAILNWSSSLQGVPLIWYLGVIGAYAFPYCLAFSGGTYHFPVMGIVVALAGVGLSLIISRGWKSVFRSRIVWTALLVFLPARLNTPRSRWRPVPLVKAVRPPTNRPR